MIYFVSGTDTDVGKSVATGFLARRLAARGMRVITQKLVQTGCAGIADDIKTHRKIMGIDFLPEDLDFTTCADVYAFPCSPHLAAEMEGKFFDYDAAARRTTLLASRYDAVLVEGAGGLMVPLSGDFLTIDYIAKYSLPLYLVASSKLGGLNHALLSLEACARRGIEVAGVVYNTHAAAPKVIEQSTADFIKKYLSKNMPLAEFIEMGDISGLL